MNANIFYKDLFAAIPNATFNLALSQILGEGTSMKKYYLREFVQIRAISGKILTVVEDTVQNNCA